MEKMQMMTLDKTTNYPTHLNAVKNALVTAMQYQQNLVKQIKDVESQIHERISLFFR